MSSPERPRPVRTILVLLLANAVVFGVGEWLARAFHVPDRMNGFPARMLVVTDDPDLPYYLRPNYRTIARGMDVRLNGHGMRGPDVPDRPREGVHRILALGGSTTFGEALSEEEAWPAALEREMESRTGEPYEVLNGGVEGYNATAELAFLSQRGLPLAPRTVVVGFSLDDGNVAPVMGPLGVLARDPGQRVSAGALANRSKLYLSLRLLPTFGWGFLTQDLSAGRRKNLPPDSKIERGLSARRKAFFRDRPEPRWTRMVEALRGFAEVGRTQGVRVVVAILPDADQVHADAPDLHPQAELLELCARLGLECLDLRPVLERAEGGLFLDGVHPTARGYRAIAHGIADHLLAERS